MGIIRETKFWKDTRAISYPLFLIIFTLIIGTVVYIVATPVVNVMTDIFNGMVGQGDTVSAQTADCYDFQINLYKIMPLFFILGLFLFAVVQALLKKGTEG